MKALFSIHKYLMIKVIILMVGKCLVFLSFEVSVLLLIYCTSKAINTHLLSLQIH
jgi:energy-converting hydrogenase Eha subunit E